jgi:type II secretory pathway pseudopilin PulG
MKMSDRSDKLKKRPRMVPVIRRRSENGDTLIEVLLALVVLSLASVALIVGFGTVISASAEHRSSSNDNLALQSLAQSFISQIQANSGYFTYACTSSYDTTSVYPGSTNAYGFGLSTTEDGHTYYGNYVPFASNPIEYWNGTSFSTVSTPGGNGCYANVPQLITIELYGSNVVGTPKTLSFVVANPLGTSLTASGTNTPYSLVITNPLANSYAGTYLNGPTPVTSPPVAGQAGLAVTGSWQPQVQIVDSKGNTVTTDLSPVVISITGVSGTGTGSNCIGTENAGFVIFAGCVISSAGTYYVQATDLNTTINPSSYYEVTISAAGNFLTFTKPSSATSGGVSGNSTTLAAGASGSAMTTQPQVWVVNSSGAQVAGWTGTINLTSTGGVLGNNGGSCATLSATNGYVAATGCTFAGAYTPGSEGNYLVSQYELVATSSGVVSATSSAFGVTSYGPATTLAFYAQPIGVAAGSLAAPAAGTAFATQSVVIPNITTVTAQAVVVLEDSFGNVVMSDKNSANAAVGLTFALSTGETMSGCTATLATGTQYYKTSSGYFSITGCSGNHYLNNVTLTATGSPTTGLTPSSVQSSPFNITYLPAAGGLQFSTQPVAGASGSAFTTMPVLNLYDPSGNPVTAYNGASLTLTATGTGGTLSTCTNLILSASVDTVQNCTFSGLETTTYYLNASVTVGALTLTATSSGFSPNSPGPATQLVFATQPVGGAAGSALATMPTVGIEDSAGNLVTTSSAVITLATNGGTLSNCTNLVATAGIVNVTNCTFGGTVGSTYTLTAASTGLTSASTTFSLSGPGAPTTLYLNVGVTGSSCTPSIVYNATCLVTATIQDAYGNTETAVTTPIAFGLSGVGTVSVSGYTQTNGVASETLTGTGIGIVSVVATEGSLTSSTGTFNVNGLPQTITWTAPGTQTWVVGGAGTFSLGAASDSAGTTVTFASSTTNVCTVSGTTVTMLTAGTCTITPTAPAGGNYAVTTGTASNITINGAAQTITWTAPGAQTWVAGGAGTFSLGAASDSGGTTVTFASSTTNVCTVSGTTVTMLTAGTCTITPTATAGGNYAATTGTASNITINKIGQTTTFTSTSPGRSRTGLTYTPTATATSGLTPTITLDNTSSGCSINGGGVVTFTGPGTCVIDANQAGNTNYNAAAQVQQSITVVTVGFTSLGTAGSTTSATVATGTVTTTSTNKVIVLISFASSGTNNACATPVGSAFGTWTALVGPTPYGFATGAAPYDYMCAYSAVSNGGSSTVSETFTGTAGNVLSATIQVLAVTGDANAVFTNVGENAATNTTPVFNLYTTPSTTGTSLEILFGAVKYANGSTTPTWSTTLPNGFTYFSIQGANGSPSLIGAVYYGVATQSTTGSIATSDPWGAIGIEIKP